MAISNADLEAYGLHSKFNAWLKELSSRDIRQFGLNGNRFEDRIVPPEAMEYARTNRAAGFKFILVLKDRKGVDAYVFATHNGNFWPLQPGRADGMGSVARNAWAAKELSQRFQAYGGPMPETEAEILARLDRAIDRILAK